MARDLKKFSAFDSGMRGSEKPRVSESSNGGESKQDAGTKVGEPDGEGLSAFSSGMRGSQKPPASATRGPKGGGGESKQGAGTVVDEPNGTATAKRGSQSTSASAANGAAQDAHAMDENSLELSPDHQGPEAHEDDTHINVRIPKSSIKRKAASSY